VLDPAAGDRLAAGPERDLAALAHAAAILLEVDLVLDIKTNPPGKG
jgi:hypothetical protein